jgi:hypothetical protein
MENISKFITGLMIGLFLAFFAQSIYLSSTYGRMSAHKYCDMAVHNNPNQSHDLYLRAGQSN